MIAAVAMTVPMTLVHLSTVDIAIIVFYFGLVLTIGTYLRGQSRTGEDFFMAGRRVTPLVGALGLVPARHCSRAGRPWAPGAPPNGSRVTPRSCVSSLHPPA